MGCVVLLGPQRYRPTLAGVFTRVGAEGPVATVTAGWEEREDELDELGEHLGREVMNLRLHGRTEHIFQRDQAFLDAWRVRRLRLREAQAIYRERLHYLMESLRQLARRPDDDLVREERRDAMRAVRRLDARHLDGKEAIHAEFQSDHAPAERESVALQRERVTELLEECGSVALAGGHVAVLRNRLRLFGIADRIGDRDVFAWSAGAMCATERIVIYHDSPPQGPGDAAVLEYGLGLCPGVVALPHAAKRLRLDDGERVGLFARRFAPQACVALDDASGLKWDGKGWELLGDGARRLRTDGEVAEMRQVGDAA
jgi:hypothetical protein